MHALNSRPPAQRAYAAALAERSQLDRPIVSLGYANARRLASLTRTLPPPMFDARFRPLRYANDRFRPLLGECADIDVLQWMAREPSPPSLASE